ncbi:MAG: [citrate (pro-3S)-lyase] ligase [Synergistaceae bacterium]|nr:[citrate (pro-3S)-lyase] ligase [Synergistaceae bacterium]
MPGRLLRLSGKGVKALFGLEERMLETKRDLEERAALLASRDLAVPEGEDLVLGLFQGDRLVAAGALVGNILQGIAVAREMEGEGAAAAVTSALLKKAVERGMRKVFLYSKPQEARIFQELGFSLLATAAVEESGLGAALLEWGAEGIEGWKARTAKIAEGKPARAGAAVVNCNPFTLGHRRLLEYAAGVSPWLYVLVVQEDRSLFPFDVRLRLVREGTADLENVTVLPGGPYVISSATFPAYFTRVPAGGDPRKITELYAALDLEMFRRHVAPTLGIAIRYVGTEPYCPVTSVYNDRMKRILPVGGEDCPPVEVREIPRFERDGRPVSASLVRELIREGRLGEATALVPKTTAEWLKSEEAAPVLEKIRTSGSRH